MNPASINPDPWLQYGALGLLGLVLVGFASFLAIFAHWAGKFLQRITYALERMPDVMGEVKEELAEFKTGTMYRLDSIERRDAEMRAEIASIPEEVTDRIKPRSYTPQDHKPTVRISKERLDTLRSESERQPPAIPGVTQGRLPAGKIRRPIREER